MSTLREVASICQLYPESQALVEELVIALAKAECKRHKEIPSWSKLNSKQHLAMRKIAVGNLMVVADFFQNKLDEEK